MKKNQIIVFLALVMLSSYVISQVSAETIAPGSVADPLITKSYLDQNIQLAVSSELAKQTSVQVVTLQQGETLFADAGTEIIVRTGTTVAVSKDSNGIPDLTSGKDIAPGALIETNHLLLFPRDGRGIKGSTTNKSDIYVVIRGGYNIVKIDGTIVNP